MPPPFRPAMAGQSAFSIGHSPPALSPRARRRYNYVAMQSASPQTGRQHEEPFAFQFSVFLANRIGQLRDLLATLAEKNVELYGICVVEASDWAVIRMVCSDPNRARALLAAHGLSFTENEVLLTELPGPAALSEICTHLVGAELNINFAYPLSIRSHGNPVMVLHTDDHVLAVHLLTRHGFTLLGAEDLADPT